MNELIQLPLYMQKQLNKLYRTHIGGSFALWLKCYEVKNIDTEDCFIIKK